MRRGCLCREMVHRDIWRERDRKPETSCWVELGRDLRSTLCDRQKRDHSEVGVLWGKSMGESL